MWALYKNIQALGSAWNWVNCIIILGLENYFLFVYNYLPLQIY